TIGANDSGKVAQPRISAGADVTVGEGQGYDDVPIKLSHPGRSEVTVQYFTTNSTAVGNADYICPAIGNCDIGTLTFAPGETIKTVRIDLIDDVTPEPRETFLFNLQTPTSATIARAAEAITIRDND